MEVTKNGSVAGGGLHTCTYLPAGKQPPIPLTIRLILEENGRQDDDDIRIYRLALYMEKWELT